MPNALALAPVITPSVIIAHVVAVSCVAPVTFATLEVVAAQVM